MQLLNPQQEHALPRATTRLSAYLYGGAELKRSGRAGVAAERLAPRRVTGRMCAGMVRTCVTVNRARSRVEMMGVQVRMEGEKKERNID